MTTQTDEIIEAIDTLKAPLDPSHIMQVGMGFFATKTCCRRSSSSCSR